MNQIEKFNITACTEYISNEELFNVVALLSETPSYLRIFEFTRQRIFLSFKIVIAHQPFLCKRHQSYFFLCIYWERCRATVDGVQARPYSRNVSVESTHFRQRLQFFTAFARFLRHSPCITRSCQQLLSLFQTQLLVDIASTHRL